MSTGIVDIEDTPDVATWNMKIHIKDDAAYIVDDRFRDAEKIQTTLTTGIGAIESGSTLTDEATDLS